MFLPFSVTRKVVRQDVNRLQESQNNVLPEGLIEYFLEVQIEVAANRRQQFAKLGRDFLDNFKNNGLTPVVSAWRPLGASPIFAVNYWSLGADANQLLKAELRLPDVPGFTEFNAILQSESKNLTVRVARGEHRDTPQERGDAQDKLPSEHFRYLRVVSKVAIPNLPEFVAGVEGYMRPFSEGNDWYLGDSYLTITGPEGMLSQLWIIPTAVVPDVSARLENAPWLKEGYVTAPPDFQILEATFSDPNLQARE
jgi:hypothetical protein